MKMTLKNRFLMVVLSMMAGASFGADGIYSPIANLTERWTNDASWSVYLEGTPSVVDASMSLAFPGQELPIPMKGSLKADALASGGRFVGDYIASGIDKVSFSVMRVGLGSEAKLRFTGKTGRRWYYTFKLPDQTGVWEAREVPMTYSEGWKASGVVGAAEFDADRTDVKNLEVNVLTADTSPQELRIDNFKVVGPWEKGPLTTDEMPQYWLVENGLPVLDGQAGLDKDGDGFSNYSEYLAGTDPNDSKSQFRLEIETGADGKPVLSWKHEAYRSYKVFKSSDLSLANSFVEKTGSIQAAGDKNRMTVADESSAVNFYRVQVDKQ